MSRAANAGRPPVCRYSVRMSGVFGQRLGRKNSRMGGCESSVKYCASSAAELRHAKYVYDCVNPSLASRNMTFGRVKASARKIASGCWRLTSPMSHSQNGNGLGWGVSPGGHLTPWCDPVHDDRPQLSPQLPPALRLEVERNDVLVLLRRVLGVLDRAVGPVLEPLRVLARVRVVGRALERDVEGDVHTVLAGRPDQAVKILQRAELRIDGLVPALF